MGGLPDVSSMKLSELKKELALYGIDSSSFCEKQEFKSALKNARDTLPRPSTTYREVGPSEEEIRAAEKAERAKREKPSSSRSSRKPSSSGGGSSSSSRHHAATSSRSPAPRPQSAAAPPPAAAYAQQQQTKKSDAKRLLASRSPVTALQQLREHPSEKLLGTREHSFLPGAPFSFALRGSLQENDAAILRIPDGVCLKIEAASVERKAMEGYLLQKGSSGVSLRISSEENPAMLPIWTFDKERSKSYTVSDLGVRVCGPRTIRLLAFMEMGFRSGASVDVCVFGSVGLDRDKF